MSGESSRFCLPPLEVTGISEDTHKMGSILARVGKCPIACSPEGAVQDSDPPPPKARCRHCHRVAKGPCDAHFIVSFSFNNIHT